jgi:hypothetical protein
LGVIVGFVLAISFLMVIAEELEVNVQVGEINILQARGYQ